MKTMKVYYGSEPAWNGLVLIAIKVQKMAALTAWRRTESLQDLCMIQKTQTVLSTIKSEQSSKTAKAPFGSAHQRMDCIPWTGKQELSKGTLTIRLILKD